jgi:ribonuclease PH
MMIEGILTMRPSGRAASQLRKIEFLRDCNRHAEGSCLVKFGDTEVICTASLDEKVPPFLRNSGKGWVTAEYGMLPRATHTRGEREAAKGKQSGRTQEIQRLIGRALRAVTDLSGFGERQIKIDCDVIQADGGTRTAAITGSYVALHECFRFMKEMGAVKAIPLRDQVAAISCGLVSGVALLDLDYAEDSNAEADANFVLTADGGIVEVQASAEKHAFTDRQFADLLALARQGTAELFTLQRQALGQSDPTAAANIATAIIASAKK